MGSTAPQIDFENDFFVPIFIYMSQLVLISIKGLSYLLEPLPEESIDELYERLSRILQHQPP